MSTTVLKNGRLSVTHGEGTGTLGVGYQNWKRYDNVGDAFWDEIITGDMDPYYERECKRRYMVWKHPTVSGTRRAYYWNIIKSWAQP